MAKTEKSKKTTEAKTTEPQNAEKIVSFDTEGVVTDKPEQETSDEQAYIEAIAKLQDELTKKSNALLLLQADFQNFKKRNEDATKKAHTDGGAMALTAILPVLDSLERAVKTGTEEYVKGMGQIKKQLEAVLTSLGVQEIVAEGAVFDPKYHNAVMSAEDAEHAGQVLEVFQRGYTYRGSVLRYAMVKVAN